MATLDMFPQYERGENKHSITMLTYYKSCTYYCLVTGAILSHLITLFLIKLSNINQESIIRVSIASFRYSPEQETIQDLIDQGCVLCSFSS